MLISIPVFICFPALNYIVQEEQTDVYYNSDNQLLHEAILWTCLLILVTIRTILMVTSFTSSIIIISNSVTANYLGSVNGFGQVKKKFLFN